MDNFEDWVAEPGENYETLQKKYMALVNQYARHIGHVFPYIGGIRYKEIRQGHNDGVARNYFSKKEQKRAMEWLVAQTRNCDWLEPASLISKFEEPSDWRKKMEKSLVGCFTSPLVLGRIKQGYEADPVNGYKVEDFIDDSMAAIFDASYKNKQLNKTEMNLQLTAISSLAKISGLDNLNGVQTNDKGLDAGEEFTAFMLMNSSPAIACSHSEVNMNISVSDPERSFFRLAIGENPLPESEMKPLMTRQLRKIRDLYKKASTNNNDLKTKEFYNYQLRVLNKLLKTE